ncbi:hypothetical protein JZ751_002136 [Albula glossodonta]|uniref:Uncharacterized protein n=1 Tax=Albula glossodonta TaxID=121402 RepID=A0A8T2PB05_9TELE|nr:hypothetical protein JZ751_002136 [Albula glossodonta]
MLLPRPVTAELRGPTIIGDRKSCGPTHSSQPLLFTFDVPAHHGNGALSNSAPQDYLFLHQCMSRKTESNRSASFSQVARSGMLTASDSAVQKLTHGFSHCPNDAGGQTHHGFNSLPKPGRHRLASREAYYDLPRGYSPEGQGRESVSEEAYTFKTPRGGPLASAPLLSNENYDLPSPPGSFYQMPRAFDKNHNALGPAVPESSNGGEPPPRPPKPSQGAEQQRWGSPRLLSGYNGDGATVTVAPRRNTLPAVENIRLHRGSSFENSDHHRQHCLSNSSPSAESITNGSNMRAKPTLICSDSGDNEDNYVPMNPSSSSSPFHVAQADSPQNIYIPMSPGPHHFDFPGFSSTFPARKSSTPSYRPGRLSDITPPPINRNLKPDRKSKPTPLDLRINGIIDELPSTSPSTTSWSRPMPVQNPISSLHCRPVSTQSITSTDSADSEENYVAMVSQV